MMRLLAEPTAHAVDVAAGVLTQPTGAYQKRLHELRGIYADAAAFEAACATHGDDVVYSVSECRPANAHGDMIFGVTHMQSGRIGNEFYVTRGHLHAIANRPEVYYGERGQGLLLLESPEGDTRILQLLPRVVCYVPPLWIHRTVNVGPEPFVMSFYYPADSGQDYEVIGRCGGMALRIVADGDGWRAVPNTAYRPRTAAELAQIYATCDDCQP